MRIYISHPYGGNEGNKIEIENIIRHLVNYEPRDTYISPAHLFGFMYNDVSYMKGIELCLQELALCGAVYLTGDWKNSRGCMLEYAFALGKGIPMYILNDKFEITPLDENGEEIF